MNNGAKVALFARWRWLELGPASLLSPMIQFLKQFLNHEKGQKLKRYAYVMFLLTLGALATKYLADRFIPLSAPSSLPGSLP